MHPDAPSATAANALHEQAARIRASQILGRSRLINRLFDFLVECRIRDRVPKEIEVAIDALGRDERFDPSQDAVVRVCVHKLRRKLDDYYAGAGRGEPHRLTLGRGEYRLLVDPQPPLADVAAAAPPAGAFLDNGSNPKPRPSLRQYRVLGIIVLALSVLANVWLLIADAWRQPAAYRGLREVRTTDLWSPILDDDLPIYLVVGDYYVFGEVDSMLEVKRLIRDFRINSRDDLEWHASEYPDRAAHYEDLDLSYIPTASAFALRDLMPVLTGASPRVRLTVVSQLDPSLFKTAHVIYVGYLSGLGMLRELAFAGSRFATGETFDELVDRTTGHEYVSDVGGPVEGRLRYRDYGYFATFPGPAGNQLMIIAGTRDMAVMQTAEMITDVARIAELESHGATRDGFEALYEVYGLEDTNIDARLLLSAPLRTSAIWSDGH